MGMERFLLRERFSNASERNAILKERNGNAWKRNLEDLTRVVISYEIYETSLRRVS